MVDMKIIYDLLGCDTVQATGTLLAIHKTVRGHVPGESNLIKGVFYIRGYTYQRAG